MTPEERAAALRTVLDAVHTATQTIKREIERADALVEPGAPHGALLELLRAAPECLDELTHAPAILAGYAAVLAVELRLDAGVELQERLYTVLNSAEAQTPANHVRRIAAVLLAAYGDQPSASTPVQ